MRRVASHYTYWGKCYRMHYIELDAKSCITGVFPLRQEIAGTAFFDGIVFPISRLIQVDVKELTSRLLGLQKCNPDADVFELLRLTALISNPKDNESVFLYRLYGVDLSAAKLSTNNSCGNCHIERL